MFVTESASNSAAMIFIITIPLFPIRHNLFQISTFCNESLLANARPMLRNSHALRGFLLVLLATRQPSKYLASHFARRSLALAKMNSKTMVFHRVIVTSCIPIALERMIFVRFQSGPLLGPPNRYVQRCRSRQV